MRGEQEHIYNDFSGGVNLKAAPYLLQENQARDALNVHSNSLSQLRKRRGFTTLADLSASPASFTGAPHSAAAAEVDAGDYVILAGPVTGSEDALVAVSLAGTVTNLTAGAATFDQNVRWDIVQAEATSDSKGPIFAMNGVDTPQEWDGLIASDFGAWTAASGTVPTSGRYLVYHGDRLWCAELAESGRVRYSGLTGVSPDTGAWDANDFVDLSPGDGQQITGIGTLGPYLVVFKEHKTYVITDTITGANRELTQAVGCHAHRSIVETDDGLIWLDDTGVYITGGQEVTQISDAVDPLIEDAAAFATFDNACATLVDRSYYLSLSTDGNTNNRTLQYDLETGAWWVHDCASNQFAKFSVTAGVPEFYSADPNATQVQQAFVPDTYTDSDASYTSRWTSAHFVWGAPHKRKRVRQIRIDGQGEWVLGTATDFSDDFTDDSGEVWFTTGEADTLFAPSSENGISFAPSSPDGEDFAPASVDVTSRRYYTPCHGQSVSLRIESSDSADLGIYATTVAVTARKD
jgi:hypothetical protein